MLWHVLFYCAGNSLLSCDLTAENIWQAGKVFQGGGEGALWTSFSRTAPSVSVTKSIQTEKALAISRKGLIVWLPETDLNRQPSD